MAIKLTKEQRELKVALIAELRSQQESLTTAIEAYNRGIERLGYDLELAVTAYNAQLALARDLAEQIASDVEIEMGERSQKWHDSDAGSSAQSFLDVWQSELNFDDVEIDLPNTIDEPNLDHADVLEDTPNEPD